MRFECNISENDWTEYMSKYENETIWDGEYICCFRVGDLCFDIVYTDPGDEKPFLRYDLYVGGEDTGYGYSRIEDGYPYDYADGDGFGDTCVWMTLDDFKAKAEEVLTAYINENDTRFGYSLVEKANEPLHVW